MNVTLVPANQRTRTTDQIIKQMKDELQGMPGVKVRVDRIGLFGTANQTPIQVVVSGTTYDDARKGAEQLSDILKNIPGTADVRLSSENGKPESRVEIDRVKMADFGLSLAEVGPTCGSRSPATTIPNSAEAT